MIRRSLTRSVLKIGLLGFEEAGETPKIGLLGLAKADQRVQRL